MWTILTALALGSALAALISALSALQAGLKLRRTRVESQAYLFNEVARLAGRATELEKNLAALDVRAQALPIRIAELQQNLSILRVLANTLGASLRQAQKILSFTSLKSSLARSLAETFGTRAERGNNLPKRRSANLRP